MDDTCYNSNNEKVKSKFSTKKKAKQQIKTASQILESFGPFQILSVIMFCPIYAMLGNSIIIPVFLNMVPDHYCQQNISNNITITETNALNSNGSLLNFNKTEMQCSRFVVSSLGQEDPAANNNFSSRKVPCQQWVYNLTHGNTVVSQFDLICEYAWKRPLTISSYMLGVFFSCMFGGFTVFHLVLAFSPNYWFYLVGTFCIGIVSVGYYFGFVWAQELVFTSEKRVVAAFCMNAVFAVGGAAASLVAYLVQDWSRLYIVCGVGYFLSLLPLLFVPESPSLLIERNKTEEVIKILKKICKKNNLVIASDSILKDLSDINGKTAVDAKEGNLPTRLLWQKKKLRRRLIILCLLWNISYLTYFTMAYNAANLGGNAYVNNLIGCILEIVSAATMTVMLKKLKRKQTIALLSVAVGISCILSPTLKEVSTGAGVASALIGRFFNSSANFSIVFITGEFFPTLLRNTCVCIACMSSRFCSVLMPFLVFAGEEFDWSIPFYVIGGLGFLSAFLILLLPETYNRSLPTTLKIALALKDPKAFSICKREKKGKVEEECEF